MEDAVGVDALEVDGVDRALVDVSDLMLRMVNWAVDDTGWKMVNWFLEVDGRRVVFLEERRLWGIGHVAVRRTRANTAMSLCDDG